MLARRYNVGKARFDLVSGKALRELAKTYQLGAHKYTIYQDKDGKQISGKDIAIEDTVGMGVVDSGDNNWRKGLPWMDVVACAKRHLEDFANGKDYDELGTLTLGNAMWNIATLIDFYDTHPELDNRLHWFKRPLKRLGTDLDGCLSSFEEHFLEYLDLPNGHATDWDDPRFRENYHKISNDENFWMTMPPLISPSEITYPIAAYCTARSCSKEISERWLKENGFPSAPVISVSFGESKVAALKDICDVFIDDSIKNFIELQSNGILCFLKSRPHNKKYDVGHFRVNSMQEFFEKVRNLG